MGSLQWPSRLDERLPIATASWREYLHTFRATVLLCRLVDVNALLTLYKVTRAPASCEFDLLTLA